MKNEHTYTREHTSEISFPLGGIGSGSVGLAGNGALIDWEVFNRPAKGSLNGFSHFAIRVEDDQEVVDARVLQGDLQPPYTGTFRNTHFFEGFGWGPRRETMAGFPHFTETVFQGRFPLAELAFLQESFPGAVTLEAFNPFIPLEEDDSSLPAAFFTVGIRNTTRKPLRYTVIAAMTNPNPGPAHNRFEKDGPLSVLRLDPVSGLPDDPEYRELCVGTDAAEVSYQEYWYRGAWFDNLEVYWQDLNRRGAFRNRSYPVTDESSLQAQENRQSDTGLIAAHIELAPGQEERVRFCLAWYAPTQKNYWGRQGGSPEADTPEVIASREQHWKNYYATLWGSSHAVVRYAFRHWPSLESKTRRFRDLLFSSSLPLPALDAVASTLSVLKSPTVLRLEDGTLYGWEGVGTDAGSCEGSCTHVWAYAQALPFLFPRLERSMRNAEFAHNMMDTGGMRFRLMLPLGSPAWNFRPCADGQFATVMKLFRDWMLCGDTEWLRSLWPKVKQCIGFAWSPANYDRWDPRKTGILTGRQHHTLDMELFGPNSWLSGIYLGALKAAEIMADALGDHEARQEYARIFQRGQSRLNAELFNGSYYTQSVTLSDKGVLAALPDAPGSMVGASTEEAYWSEEHDQLKYQLGEGLVIDQALGQWHANLYGLGQIFDGPQLRTAMKSLYDYNFVGTMRERYNPCRIYSLNDESGLVICSWPNGCEKPAIPIPYSQEAMHGFEYAAAALMLQCGLIEEGEQVVRSVRQRYDGRRRNPWNEIECGSNYARSMAAYSILLCYSGFRFDRTRDLIGFLPLKGHGRFFWSLDSAWGVCEMGQASAVIEVAYGELSTRRLVFPRPDAVIQILADGRDLAFTNVAGEIVLQTKILMCGGSTVTILYS